MPKYSIIIPVCGQEEMTNACLESVFANSSDYEVIIVNNGSKFASLGVAKTINNESNLGFPKAINQGIKEATGEIIVLLNNDTRVGPQWLEHLSACFNKFDIVGPVSNCVSGPQQVSVQMYSLPNDVDVVANNLAKYHMRGEFPLHRLVFFCVAIKRKVIDKIGLLDEQFSPGNFEDDDYCLRAIDAGFKLGVAKNCFIYHKGSVTHKSLNLDYVALLNRNEAIFKEKWPEEKIIELIAKNNQ